MTQSLQSKQDHVLRGISAMRQATCRSLHQWRIAREVRWQQIHIPCPIPISSSHHLPRIMLSYKFSLNSFWPWIGKHDSAEPTVWCWEWHEKIGGGGHSGQLLFPLIVALGTRGLKSDITIIEYYAHNNVWDRNACLKGTNLATRLRVNRDVTQISLFQVQNSLQDTVLPIYTMMHCFDSTYTQ